MGAVRVAIHANYAVAERRELIILNVDEAQAARRAEGRKARSKALPGGDAERRDRGNKRRGG